jgi:hypothetical protein
MIAEVIPLRRRTHHGAWPPDEAEPDHSGVFDPPPDPEPPEEYSVWERPTAELVRREPAGQPRALASHRRHWASVRTRHGASVALVVIAGAVLALALEHSHPKPQRSANTGVAGGQLGLGTPLGAAGGPARTSRAAPLRSSSRGPRGHHRAAQGSVSPTRSSAEAAASTMTSAPVAPTSTSAPEPAHTETSSTVALPAVETATAKTAREFGFER